jgi:hypothetical protein
VSSKKLTLRELMLTHPDFHANSVNFIHHDQSKMSSYYPEFMFEYILSDLLNIWLDTDPLDKYYENM